MCLRKVICLCAREFYIGHMTALCILNLVLKIYTVTFLSIVVILVKMNLYQVGPGDHVNA